MAWPVSAAFRDAINSSDQRHKIQVDVCEFDGTVVYSDLPIEAGGTVSADETAEIRRTLSLTVPTTPAGSAGSFVPVNAGDLLHPLSGYELRPYRGVVYPDGTTEMVPLGVFPMTQPVVTDGPGNAPGDTTGAGVQVAVSGNDRAMTVSLVTYQQPYVVPANTDVATAIYDLLDTMLPGLTYIQMESGYALPGATFGQDPTQQNDPFSDAQSMAATAGMELFFDELGRVVLRTIPVVGSAMPWTTYGYAGGAYIESARIITTQQTLDETQEYDGLILVCNGPGGAPTQVNVGNTGTGTHVYMMTTQLLPNPGLSDAENAAQALVMAQNQFNLISRAWQYPEWTCVPDGSVAVGDPVSLYAPRMGVDDTYIVGQITYPLDVATSQTMTATSQNPADTEDDDDDD